MERRNFLKFLGIAPIAAPVAAKEAAHKMGLSGLIGGADVNEVAEPSYASSFFEDDDFETGGWEKKRLGLMDDPITKKDRLRQARIEARWLDPDIAAWRSVSPAVAHQIQTDRTVARNYVEEKFRLEHALWRKLTKIQ